MDADENLEAGIDVLADILAPRGFRYEHVRSGPSSNGPYAVGRWSKGDRILELHVRPGLGIVMYGLGDQWLNHSDYMDRLGVMNRSFPGYGPEPLDAFSHLRSDLVHHCGPFLDGTDVERFLAWAAEPIERRRFLP